MRSVIRARWQLSGSLALMMVIPALIYFDILPYRWRLALLIALGLLFSAVSYVDGFTFGELGLRRDNLRKALVMQLPVVVLLLSVLSLAHRFGFVEREFLSKELFFLFYVFVSAPFQEFIYRAYMFALLRRSGLHNRFLFLFFMAVPYGFVHVIYHSPLTLLVTMVAGLLLSYAYIRQSNLFAVSFSHAMLGFVALSLGVI